MSGRNRCLAWNIYREQARSYKDMQSL
jgi:hypothetical protein